MIHIADQLAQAQALNRRDADRIAGLLKLLEKERAKAMIPWAGQSAAPLADIKALRDRLELIYRERQVHPARMLLSPSPPVMSHCAREALDEVRVHEIRRADAMTGR